MSYETWLQQTAPAYLQDTYGQAWLGGIGAAMDDYVQQYIAGVKAAFPDYAPSDALGIIGDEFGIDRGPTETDASYAARLVGAWTAWKYAGTPVGILAGLYWAGFSGGVLVQQNGLACNLSGALTAGADPSSALVVTTCMSIPVVLTSSVIPPTISSVGRSIPASTHWWTFDFNTDFCSRFALIYPTAPALYPFNGTDLARLQATIKKWRPAKATCVGINVLTSGHFLGWPTTRTLGNGDTLGGAVVTYAGA